MAAETGLWRLGAQGRLHYSKYQVVKLRGRSQLSYLYNWDFLFAFHMFLFYFVSVFLCLLFFMLFALFCWSLSLWFNWHGLGYEN